MYYNNTNVPEVLIKTDSTTKIRTTFKLIVNHLGSVQMVVNANTGEIAQQMQYDEFGNVTLDTNPGFQPFGFAGGIYDRDTGLTRFGARDYDPVTGRWTSKDPIGFEGGDTSLYGYIGSDPVNYTDPSGKNALRYTITFTIIAWTLNEIVNKVPEVKKKITKKVREILGLPRADEVDGNLSPDLIPMNDRNPSSINLCRQKVNVMWINFLLVKIFRAAVVLFTIIYILAKSLFLPEDSFFSSSFFVAVLAFTGMASTYVIEINLTCPVCKKKVFRKFFFQ